MGVFVCFYLREFQSVMPPIAIALLPASEINAFQELNHDAAVLGIVDTGLCVCTLVS